MPNADTSPTAPAPTSAAALAEAGYPAWRASRLASVVSPTGNLALIETRWLGADESADEAFAAALKTSPASVIVTRLERRNLETGKPEYGIRL